MSSPTNPDLYTPIRHWLPANAGGYAAFRNWLRKAGYSESAVSIYSCAVRLAISQLDKPYWQISVADLDAMRQLIADRFPRVATQQSYNKGLRKLAEWLAQRQGKPQPPKPINWDYFLGNIPPIITTTIRGYLRYRQRSWPAEEQQRLTADCLGTLTRFLRWAAQQGELTSLTDLTPTLWFGYVDARLAAGIGAATLNRELHHLQSWLRYLQIQEQPICDRLLRVEKLKEGSRLPKDVSISQLQQVAAEIEAEITSPRQGKRRCGLLDRVWWQLMLYSGLRVGEVRRLRQADLDLAGKRVRIEQSKGLKDRLAYLSQATVDAIEEYLPLRGPSSSDHLFLYRHRPLTPTYCAQRLRTYGKRCGVTIRPHQLRHSCATLLLNVGAPILTVQALLGHEQLDTTLHYARLYDSTVAADYYRAMATIEQRLQPTTNPAKPPPHQPAQLIAMLDALGNGTLNDSQRQLVHELRSRLLGLVEQEEG